MHQFFNHFQNKFENPSNIFVMSIRLYTSNNIRTDSQISMKRGTVGKAVLMLH